MSDNSTSDAHSISMPPSSGQSIVTQRIERFQAATQDLLALYAPDDSAQETGSLSDSRGETRCYHLSPSTLQHERELLKRYQAEDFRGLLEQTHILLVGLVKIMKSTHPDARFRGYVISSLGCLLEQASALVLRMRNVYEKVERIGE